MEKNSDIDKIERLGENNTALSVKEGINQPPSINKRAAEEYKCKKQKSLCHQEYFKGILKGDRVTLSRAITLVESSLPKHQELSQKIIELCLPHSGKSKRIAISGVPGAGKSTLIEALGKYLTSRGNKVAVLAIDPSSERSKGSILGDKTRMEELSTDPNAFIRPSPSAGTLGGVARKTRETIILCEAAGYNIVLIETVGVGQSEVAAASMVDLFLLVIVPGTGDELQGIKRGIMEMADIIVVNKADGSNLNRVKTTVSDFSNALNFFPLPPSGWKPVVLTCSALEKKGIDEIWLKIEDYFEFVKNNGYFDIKRKEQSLYRMYDAINESLKNCFYNNEKVKSLLKKTEEDLLNNKISSYQAAQRLLDVFFDSIVIKD